MSLHRIRRLYHRHVPARVRFPLGRTRRSLIDLLIRLSGRHGPLPPRRVLRKVQITPWVMEYLEVGERCAATVRRVLAEAGVGDGARVLDFGCGLGRTLRHLEGCDWELWGCDVDRASVDWSRRACPFARLEVNGPDPPLPFAAELFDAVYAISVFSHFPGEQQAAWAEELARVLRPGGAAVITTMGPWAFDPMPVPPEESPVAGFWFYPAGSAFNDSAAIHAEEGLRHFFEPWFEPVRWRRGGLDGFQDLGLFRRR